MAPGRDKSNDGTIGDTSHQARPSDHNPNKDGVVTAMDITPRSQARRGCGRAGGDPAGCPRSAHQVRDLQPENLSAAEGAVAAAPYNGANAHTQHVHVSVMGEKGTLRRHSSLADRAAGESDRAGAAAARRTIVQHHRHGVRRRGRVQAQRLRQPRHHRRRARRRAAVSLQRHAPEGAGLQSHERRVGGL